MNPKIIKNNREYEAALARIEELMSAKPGTRAGNELELWSFLVESYERQQYPIELPDPVSAIRFRMDQEGLRDTDLIPYLGSKSKVSEVLNGKRPLSLTMIRRLHEGLGIPAEVLLQEPGARLSEAYQGLNWRLFPLAEIAKRQWIPGFRGSWRELLENAEELLGPFLFPPGLDVSQPVCPRQNVRSGSKVNEYALRAWIARVIQQAESQDIAPYVPDSVTEEFIKDIARLSRFDNGPDLAREALAESGIHFVIERHLPGTHLDGMAMWSPDRAPLVAMTLRYNRLDNFWFTLCHELAHIALHLRNEETAAFIDDLDAASKNEQEHEADVLATNSLIPASEWTALKGLRWTESSVLATARRLRVNPAIVAGRIRREKGNYMIFGKLLGHRRVRI